MSDQVQKLKAWMLVNSAVKGPDRRIDVEVGKALGWRVSHDEWWNWRGYVEGKGPVYDPPGDAWCIRRDGRKDVPCDEHLPTFTFIPRQDAKRLIEEA